MNTKLFWVNKACNSLDVPVGSFVTSWLCLRQALGGILVGQPLLGRFAIVPRFLHLEIMGLTVVCWSPRVLEISNPFHTVNTNLCSPFHTDIFQLPFQFSRVWWFICSNAHTSVNELVIWIGCLWSVKSTNHAGLWPTRTGDGHLWVYMSAVECYLSFYEFQSAKRHTHCTFKKNSQLCSL